MKFLAAVMYSIVTVFSFFSAMIHAFPTEIESTTQAFSVRLGSTRVIYDPESNGTSLQVMNPQDYPILLQSEVLGEDMKTRAPFIVTPPLMRLDAQQKSRLRIIRVGGRVADGRETMQWICTKGIPPKEGDIWAKDGTKDLKLKDKVSVNVQLSINSCIKLFIRPTDVKGTPTDVAGNVTWQWQNGKLKGVNNSPFYINLTSLSVGGVNVGNTHYIPPFGYYLYSVKGEGKGKQVVWKIVTDYGGDSNEYRAKTQ